MRTVDPELWSKKVKGRKIDLARPFRFGLKQSGFEARLKGSYRDAMGEFWRHCSVEGIKHLMSEDIGKRERYYWLLLLAVFLFCGVLVVSHNVAVFVAAPTLQVSLKSAQHSVRHLPFPAVALCSYNVVSQSMLEKLTNLLVTRDKNHTYSRDVIRQNLLAFGALQTLSLPTFDLQFMPYLNYLKGDDITGYGFNITNLLFLLAPTCDSMLVKCSWRGGEMPCNLLFSARLTSVGYCCVFNSRYEQVDLNNPPKILDLVGQDYGLSVIVQENSDDFAFLRRPMVGTEVLIFDGSEYPLLEGGGVRVQLANRNATVRFKLSTRAQLASANLEYYPESWRGCRMRRDGLDHSLRSYSWCLTECRRLAAQQLCGCVPYMLQPRGEVVCSLNHLSCLNKHREMFLYYYYNPEPGARSVESEDALECAECRADCARLDYSADVSRIPFQQPDQKLFKNTFTAGFDSFVNMTVLRFFYPTDNQLLFTIEGNTVWFEVFASISSQWVALLGVTLVTVLELIFHCTVRWRHHYVRRKLVYTNHATPSDI